MRSSWMRTTAQYTKYHSKPCFFDGHRFASQKEGQRYLELKLLVKQGLITNLILQPKFPITIDGIKICTYIADFKYTYHGKEVIEDVKGMQTAIFKLKRKLVEACLGIKITLIA